MGAMVIYAGQVLRRAHALFGEGSGTLGTIGGELRDAGSTTRAGSASAAALSGRLPSGYGAFAATAAERLDRLASADDELESRTQDASVADRTGRAASGRVMDGAAVDTARIAPVSGTAAGQRALMMALRERISQQQAVIAAYRVRDARMAAALRTVAYQRGSGFGGGFGSAPSLGGGGGGLGSGSPLSALSPWDGAGRHPDGAPPRIERVDRWTVPDGPGADAARAALTKRGRPYVWGAKGPNVFDCSGLTQWAWRQAGVQLGGDTYAQIRDGVPIPPDQVRAGDLIFPASSFGEAGHPGPGHVMLAISATQVVHAPHTGDVVRVAPMPSGFIARRPVPLTHV